MKDEFGETDYVCDLFKDIKNAYDGKISLFDKITQDDVIIAFFPCIRFEEQIQLHFRGTAMQMKNWSDEKKLENCLKLHKELSQLYEIITKLVIVCLRRKISLIIENPYSTTHYLVKYWSIKANIIDLDRTRRGDYYKKPTQYWFINCKLYQNMILEAYTIHERKNIEHTYTQTERSMISKEYANRFIREFIIKE